MRGAAAAASGCRTAARLERVAKAVGADGEARRGNGGQRVRHKRARRRQRLDVRVGRAGPHHTASSALSHHKHNLFL